MKYSAYADLTLRLAGMPVPADAFSLAQLTMMFRPEPCESCGTPVAPSGLIREPDGTPTDKRAYIEIVERPELGVWHTPERCQWRRE